MPETGNALADVFRRRYRRACKIARAPGRVNLIGEHTDYNDGFVLPAAIDRFVRVAFAPRDDATLRGYSVDFDDERVAAKDDLTPRHRSPIWFDYAAGVAWVLGEEGIGWRGLDFALAGDVPIGAGLSSSAALELAIARALWDASGMSWDGKRAAVVGQRVENDYIGLASGIMDQMASALSRPSHAMLLDCRSLEYETVPLPAHLEIVVLDTGSRREVAGSAYNDRRRACERVVSRMRRHRPDIAALRDVTLDELEAHRDELDPTDYRRALHVVRENERTVRMARALAGADELLIGRLMMESHQSLRELYEVSSAELDRVVSVARAHPACCGARMTGAGFGGCAVALVHADGTDAFTRDVKARHGAGAVYVCRAVGGAELIQS